jgi:diacylglycerol kinase (ATP)
MSERRFAHRGWGKARLRSFVDAGRGLRLVLASQVNAQIHAVATLVVVGAGFAFRLVATEWALIVSVITLVWTAEAVNTAIESVVDLVSPERHTLAGKAKDAAAGAVLAAAVGAVVVGACIFGPKIAALLN